MSFEVFFMSSVLCTYMPQLTDNVGILVAIRVTLD